MKSAFFALIIAIFAIPVPAFAGEVGHFGDWSAQISPDACFNISKAVSSASMPGRKKPELAVTDHISERLFDAVTVGSGFDDADGATATISVDNGPEFHLLPFNGVGFVSSRLEPSLIEALSRGQKAVVKWTTPLGATLTDVYSLNGFNASRSAAKNACSG